MNIIDFIRHAESDCNLNGTHLIGGRSNHTPLSPNGIIQAQKLGMRLKLENYAPDFWIASPAIRTMETAKIVMEIVAPKAQLIMFPQIQEISQGDWEGLLRNECYNDEHNAKIKADCWNTKAPNGESPRDVEDRMLAFIREWFQNKQDTTTAAFTHGYAIKCALAGIYDWDRRRTHYTPIDNTSITTIFDQYGGLYTSRVNDHAHLRAA